MIKEKSSVTSGSKQNWWAIVFVGILAGTIYFIGKRETYKEDVPVHCTCLSKVAGYKNNNSSLTYTTVCQMEDGVIEEIDGLEFYATAKVGGKYLRTKHQFMKGHEWRKSAEWWICIGMVVYFIAWTIAKSD